MQRGAARATDGWAGVWGSCPRVYAPRSTRKRSAWLSTGTRRRCRRCGGPADCRGSRECRSRGLLGLVVAVVGRNQLCISAAREGVGRGTFQGAPTNRRPSGLPCVDGNTRTRLEKSALKQARHARATQARACSCDPVATCTRYGACLRNCRRLDDGSRERGRGVVGCCRRAGGSRRHPPDGMCEGVRVCRAAAAHTAGLARGRLGVAGGRQSRAGRRARLAHRGAKQLSRTVHPRRAGRACATSERARRLRGRYFGEDDP